MTSLSHRPLVDAANQAEPANDGESYWGIATEESNLGDEDTHVLERLLRKWEVEGDEYVASKRTSVEMKPHDRENAGTQQRLTKNSKG
ncbi:hypothetical protein HO133_002529 [Letharia lupina]|uniref:Uncharacterized protein n=1 Tax=Letharia lupina TaxID=560253 RepID=A0A8H6FAP7_9LECA|nr:uncharacterized protein HO133_002529 [Letharia lupina]KAF6220849.1 hypothetical protein HO133_002529 [Letharia lupina]